MKDKIKVKKENIYACKSCRITSETNGRMCPCPRGGCEATQIGKKIITTEIIINKK